MEANVRADRHARLRALMRGDILAKSHVTSATPVTLQPSYGSNAPKLQALQLLQVREGGEGKSNHSSVTAPATGPLDPDESAIEERAGLALDSVPPAYLDEWAKLNHHKPARVSDAEWLLALDDGGRFLDQFGWQAAELDWRPNELFAVRAGLFWRLCGEAVEAIYYDRVLLASRFVILRQETRGFR
jgi:hypothetical protein